MSGTAEAAARAATATFFAALLSAALAPAGSGAAPAKRAPTQAPVKPAVTAVAPPPATATPATPSAAPVPGAEAGAELTPAFLNSRAWEDFRAGEFGTAVRGFTEALGKAPKGSEEYLRGLYGLGMAWNLRGIGPDPALAEKYLKEAVSLSPTGDLAAWSLLALARMRHAVPVGTDPDYGLVRKSYQEVVDRFPFHPAGEEAFIFLQSTWVATLVPADAERSLAALTAFIKEHPQSKFLSGAWALAAECNATLGRPDERLKAKIASLEAREIDPTNPYSDNASLYWEIATIAEFEAGDFSVARKYYKGFVDEYPQDQRRWGARLALERLDAVEKSLRKGGR